MSRLTIIAYGSLPTPNAVFNSQGRPRGVTADELLRVMRASLRRHGPTEGLRAMLRALGFDWREPTVSDLDLDVARVADALSGFRGADNDDSDGGR